jgi:hypothetical protein
MEFSSGGSYNGILGSIKVREFLEPLGGWRFFKEECAPK